MDQTIIPSEMDKQEINHDQPSSVHEESGNHIQYQNPVDEKQTLNIESTLAQREIEPNNQVPAEEQKEIGESIQADQVNQEGEGIVKATSGELFGVEAIPDTFEHAPLSSKSGAVEEAENSTSAVVEDNEVKVDEVCNTVGDVTSANVDIYVQERIEGNPQENKENDDAQEVKDQNIKNEAEETQVDGQAENSNQKGSSGEDVVGIIDNNRDNGSIAVLSLEATDAQQEEKQIDSKEDSDDQNNQELLHSGEVNMNSPEERSTEESSVDLTPAPIPSSTAAPKRSGKKKTQSDRGNKRKPNRRVATIDVQEGNFHLPISPLSSLINNTNTKSSHQVHSSSIFDKARERRSSDPEPSVSANLLSASPVSTSVLSNSPPPSVISSAYSTSPPSSSSSLFSSLSSFGMRSSNLLRIARNTPNEKEAAPLSTSPTIDIQHKVFIPVKCNYKHDFF